jgi:hypothetical protein
MEDQGILARIACLIPVGAILQELGARRAFSGEPAVSMPRRVKPLNANKEVEGFDRGRPLSVC